MIATVAAGPLSNAAESNPGFDIPVMLRQSGLYDRSIECHKFMKAQPRDEAWATTRERKLSEIYFGEAWRNQGAFFHVECRKTVCELIVLEPLYQVAAGRPKEWPPLFGEVHQAHWKELDTRLGLKALGHGGSSNRWSSSMYLMFMRGPYFEKERLHAAAQHESDLARGIITVNVYGCERLPTFESKEPAASMTDGTEDAEL